MTRAAGGSTLALFQVGLGRIYPDKRVSALKRPRPRSGPRLRFIKQWLVAVR
jgi:hypothetical protein